MGAGPQNHEQVELLTEGEERTQVLFGCDAPKVVAALRKLVLGPGHVNIHQPKAELFHCFQRRTPMGDGHAKIVNRAGPQRHDLLAQDQTLGVERWVRFVLAPGRGHFRRAR